MCPRELAGGLPGGDGTELRDGGTSPGRVCVCELVCPGSGLYKGSPSADQCGGLARWEVGGPDTLCPPRSPSVASVPHPVVC